MYIMFIYINKKVYNSMGIREDDLKILYQKASEISEKIFTDNPQAQIDVKITMYN